MIIVKIRGGLGNQMFQYAAGKAVAYRAGLPLKLDITHFKKNRKRSYRLGRFNITGGIATGSVKKQMKSK